MSMILFDLNGFETGVEHDSDSATKDDEEKVYCCIRCGTAVTSVRNEISIDGGFKHSFTNPHGFMFTVGCFSEAPGCSSGGPPTSDFTWFPGYAWRIGLCGNCGLHLGWQFSGEHSSFFGLILKNLSRGGNKG